MNTAIAQSSPTRETSATEGRPLRLGIIFNTHSGRHRTRWSTSTLLQGVPAREANNPMEIGEALVWLASQNVELLAIAGGDGTVQSVLTHLLLGKIFEHMPLLALVATGSTNMTGGDVGAISVRRGGWQRLMDWAGQPGDWQHHVVSRPVLKIQPGNQAPFCGMFFGAGAIYKAVEHTQRKIHSIGLRGEVGPGLGFIRFAKAVASRDRRFLSPVLARIVDDNGHALEQEYTLLLASTLHRLLLHFRPFWGTGAAPIHWTAVEFGAHAFLRNLPAVCRGNKKAKLLPAQGYHSYNTERLELYFDGGYIVDGEFFAAHRSDGPVVLTSAGNAAFLHL